MRFHDVMCSFWSVYMYLFKSVSPVCWMYMYIVCAASVVEWIVLALCTLRKPVGTSAAALVSTHGVLLLYDCIICSLHPKLWTTANCVLRCLTIVLLLFAGVCSVG